MYSLNHSRRILHRAYQWHQKAQSQLTPSDYQRLGSFINTLNQAAQEENRQEADRVAKEIEVFTKAKQKKTFFTYAKELIVALTIALVVATIVRASWFELYEIPTGSMRPNFRELDHLSVTKLPFGINIPLMTDHLLFDPNLVQRTSAVTFTGDKIRTLDETTLFLGVFPYKKRLIKRMVGKPGDTLYFYGGQIYGIDKDGNPIEELLNSPWLAKIDYIPFMKLSGEVMQTGAHEASFMQMNKALGKVQATPFGDLTGFLWNGKSWVKDDPNALKTPHDTIKTYSDWWGMRNYASARLLNKEQLKTVAEVDPHSIPEGVLYLELRYAPSLSYPKPFFANNRGELLLGTQRSIIPLQQEDLDTLMNNLYTARLVFENGHAHRYGVESHHFDPSSDPSFSNVPDGTYEFFFGKGYQVNYIYLPLLGRLVSSSQELSKDHPLMAHSPENVQKLFNLGIEMNTAYNPKHPQQAYYPNRYVYFRNGDLYVMGAPLFKKGNSTLQKFVEQEEKKEQQSSPEKPYIAFKDHGAPIKNGKIDAAFIKTFGIQVPEKHYFVLGDNHAMSADSRVFGFVPEQNLQGAPSVILWPAGERWGLPWQKPYPFMNLPRAVIWVIIAAVSIVWYLFDRRQLRKNYSVKVKPDLPLNP